MRHAMLAMTILLAACDGKQAETGEVTRKSGVNRAVAHHVERQEKCRHWRDEQDGDTSQRPEVAEGLDRECRGIDAELASLRKRFENDGTSYDALRQFSPVE